jgi:hypothetical protein
MIYLNKLHIYCPAIILILIINSCAPTTLTSVWRDADYSSNIKKIFVIGVAQKKRVRKLFEDEFTRHLKNRGVDAVPSHQILSAEKMLDKESIVAKIKDLEIDAVLITKVVEKRKEERYKTQYAPSFRGWHDSYVTGYGSVYSTGERIEDETVVLETNLYDTGSEKVIWSTLSETFVMEYSDYHKEIKSFIKVMVKNLSKQNLIK